MTEKEILSIEKAYSTYLAKDSEETIHVHNNALLSVLDTLPLSDSERKQMERIIFLHDAGKVAQSFQGNISGKKYVRHEMLSASIKGLTDIERVVIVTHHRRFWDIYEKFEYYLDEYREELVEVSSILGVEVEDISEKVFYEYEDLLADREVIRLKGRLMFCDHLGSGGKYGLRKGLDFRLLFKFDSYTSIQESMMEENEDVLIVSPTGSGKTEASLFWASNKENSEINRMVYILPYRASINAMYDRLKKEGASVGLVHSSAIEHMEKSEDDEEVDVKLLRDKYQEHKYFANHVTVTTIFQITKFLMNGKFNEIPLSILENASIIVDEIHCYETKELVMVLSSLKYLKENYGVRICIMSASMPSKLIKKIKDELGIKKVITMKDEELEKIKRHEIFWKDKDIFSDIEKIKKSLDEGLKVLVCLNTVDRAQQMRREIARIVGEDEISMVHGRFNSKDRTQAEKSLWEKRVLIGTQAIEVSLDIDFDVLFTDVSPLDSQIQRWGRVNRKRVEKLTGRKKMHIYRNSDIIYDDDIIERSIEVVKLIGEVDEREIQELLDKVYLEDIEEIKDYESMKYSADSLIKKCSSSIWEMNDSLFGYTVVPTCLKEEYLSLFNEAKYHEASKLTLSLSDKAFFSLAGKGLARKMGRHTFEVGCMYDGKYGLLAKEKDPAFFEEDKDRFFI